MMRNSDIMIFWFLLLTTSVCFSGAEDKGLYCAYVEKKVSAGLGTGDLIIEQHAGDGGTNVTAENTTVRCKDTTEYCFTFWSVDPVEKVRIATLMQGCWDATDGKDCLYQDCAAVAVNSQLIRNNTRFCCCSGNMCNVNVTDNLNLTALEIMRIKGLTGSGMSDPNYSFRTIIISLTSVVALAIIILVVFIFIQCHLRPNHQNDGEASLFLVPPLSSLTSGQLDLDDLKLECTIHRGRYGEVFKAILNDTGVAVKSLLPNHRQFFYNEREIYMQPCMQHENIVKFCGYFERAAGEDGPAQYMIVTSYVDNGTLTNYLKNNTVDWQTMCRMWHSMTSGLAHLHTEISVGEQIKPTIAHRDFNSRNILVKSDLSCCICDFGLAMKILMPRLSEYNSVDHDEHPSLADVGTLRYMAPEVLEGSVNLYDCKTSLTQVDIYSLGLVFWEVATRCQDLYQGLPTPEYRLPFEVEAGVHPSFEDMQVLVSRNKARPAFPEIWKDSNLAIRSMKDTIEECWDQDPEARVSAVCVEERSKEMYAMWDNWHRCTTPTINYSHLKGLENKAVVQHNLTFVRSSGSTSSLTLASEPTATVSSHNATESGTSNHPTASYPREQSTSNATIETMMTLSPLETHESTSMPPATTGKPDCNLIYARMNVARQPHQGQNPTVERNTHKNSDEELAVEGNTLVNKRAVPLPQQNGNVVTSDALLLNTVTDSIMRNVDTGALIQNDILDFQNQNTLVMNDAPVHQQNGRAAPIHRPQHRISFVPNPVDAPGDQVLSEPILVRPKKQNIPSNGDINYSVTKSVPNSDKTSRLGQLKKQLIGNKASSTRKFSFPSFGWRGKPNQANGVARGSQKLGGVRQLSSEVCLVDGRTVVRPNSLALNGIQKAPNECHVSKRNLDPTVQMTAENEHLGVGRGLTSSNVVNGHQKSNSYSDASLSGSEVVNETSAKSSSGENFASSLSDSAVAEVMPNGIVAMHPNGTSDGASITISENKSSLSESSAGDNMGYEASCSPVGKVNTHMV